MLAVTTRNKLRSRRYFLPMLIARIQVRRQLEETPGIVRHATGVAGLTEFYTLTVWEDHSAMLNFMSSGSHERLMWLFTRWSAAFWSMRWRPTADETGEWNGAQLSQLDTGAPEQSADGRSWLARSPVADLLGEYYATNGRPDKRDLDPTPCGVTAVLARIPVRSPLAFTRLRQAKHAWQSAPGLLRLTLGFEPGECLLIALWQANAGGARRQMETVKARFPNAWAMQLTAGDYEIGNWDGLRLRQLARKRTAVIGDQLSVSGER